MTRCAVCGHAVTTCKCPGAPTVRLELTPVERKELGYMADEMLAHNCSRCSTVKRAVAKVLAATA